MTHDTISAPLAQTLENDRGNELDEIARWQIERAVDAVCAELGLDMSRTTSRDKIASRMTSTWRDGRRLPLNLVKAGLDAVCA